MKHADAKTSLHRPRRPRSWQALLCIAVGILPASVLALPKIDHWTDSSGVPVYFVHETSLPIVDIHLSFAAGHARDGQLKGLCNMTVSAWLQGSMGMGTDEMSVQFVRYGGSYGLYSGRENVTGSLRSLIAYHGDLDKALELFIGVLTRPDFSEKEFARVKKNALTYLRNERENPGTIAGKTFMKALYGDHPYAHPGNGYKETIEAIDLDAVRGYYERYVVSANLIITIVGDITRERAEAVAHRLATSFPKGEKAAAIPPVARLERAQTIHVPFPTEQVHVLIGQPLIEKGNPDFYALRLANHVLGGSGFGSRILEEMRNKRGLTYSSYSYFQTFRRAGPFTVGFQTKKEQLGDALNLVENLLDDFVANGIREEEYQLSLASIRGNYAMHMASNQSILGSVSSLAFYNLGIDYFNHYLDNFDRLDKERVNDTIKKHVQPQKMVTVVVGGENPWQ